MNRLLMVLLMWSAAYSANTGDRLFPFSELTDEMLETIDIHDGFIDEWYEVGEPSKTVLDCSTWRNKILPDPANLDFRTLAHGAPLPAGPQGAPRQRLADEALQSFSPVSVVINLCL